MLEFENTIQIQRPVSEVFAFLSDLENLPKWNYFVLQVKKVSDGPVGVGATYHQVRKTDEQMLRIVELAYRQRFKKVVSYAQAALANPKCEQNTKKPPPDGQTPLSAGGLRLLQRHGFVETQMTCPVRQ